MSVTALGNGWAKFRKDAHNTGKTSAVGISIPAVNWVFNSVGAWSNIAVGADKKLRFIGTDQKIYCVDASGTVSWSGSPQYSDDHFDQYSNIVLDNTDSSYVGTRNGTLYKFLADGTRVDHYFYRFCDYPINNIVFGTNGKLLAINNSTFGHLPKSLYQYNDATLAEIEGINLSQAIIGNQLYGQGIPAMHNNYLAVVFSSGFNVDDVNGQLAVIQILDMDNISSTEVKWYETPYRSFAFPAIDSSGNVYAVKGGNKLVKKTLTSSTSLFEIEIGAIANRMAPSIDANNNIIIVNAVNKLYSITSAGVITWQVDVVGLTGSAGFPVSIDGSNDIYIAQGSKLLKYGNASGNLLWSFDLTGNAVSSPVISDDGYIYVPTDQGINSIKQSAMVQISGYNVYRSIQPNVGFTKINTTIVTDSNYSDINLASGNYYYMVKAVSIMGIESDKASAIGPLKVNVSAPGKPKNLQNQVVNINNSKGIKLTWEAPLFNEDGTPLTDLAGYDVYRATIAQSSVMTSGNISGVQFSGAPFDQLSNYTNVNKINTSIVPTNTYTDFNVQSGYYYYYSIRAKDLDGNSGPYADETRGSLSVFKMNLMDGNNVIGFPFNDTTLYGTTPETSNAMQVSKFIDRIGISKVSKVMRWNENAQVYEQYPDFTTIEASKGYMVILVTDDSTTELDMSGIDWAKNTSVKFKEKLNLINLPLNDFTDVRTLVSALGGSQNVEFVTRYSKDTDKFEQYIPDVDKGDFTTLEAGYGYYVFLKKSLTDKTINFAGSPWL